MMEQITLREEIENRFIRVGFQIPQAEIIAEELINVPNKKDFIKKLRKEDLSNFMRVTDITKMKIEVLHNLIQIEKKENEVLK